MALTYTPAGELGSLCPDFHLPSVDGRAYRRETFAGRPLVVMFICNHCPYVRAIEARLLNLGRNFADRAGFVAIASNDAADHPEDAPARLLARWRDEKYPFAYLVDESQSVARAFGAVCTPDLYIYSADAKLTYRGRLDDSWREPQKVRRRELEEALTQTIEGRPVSAAQNPSMGCSIKWKTNA